MVFSDDEEEKTYSVKELREILAKSALEKAKADSDLLVRMSYLEGQLKAIGDGAFLGNPLVVPQGRPMDIEKDKDAESAHEGGSSKTSTPPNQFPYVYPKQKNIMPHINGSGPAPHYDGTHFSHWKASMESHLRSCSVELCEIVCTGFHPHDPNNLTPGEYYDRQLNATACDKIRSVIHLTLHDQVSVIPTAKDLWDRIVILQEGTSLIQKSKYEAAKSEMNMFMNHDGETIAEAYKRLVALRVNVGGLGCEKYDDGFNLNDELIKSKIVSMIAVTDKKLALNLQLLDRANQFTPDDLVSYLVATDNLADEGRKVKEINRAIGSSHSLELKAKHVQEDVASD